MIKKPASMNVSERWVIPFSAPGKQQAQAFGRIGLGVFPVLRLLQKKNPSPTELERDFHCMLSGDYWITTRNTFSASLLLRRMK